MKAILLAGGFGTRLRPLTLNTPKPIVPLLDQPFVQHQIDLIRTIPDIDEIVLSLNYQPELIQEVLKTHCPGKPDIRYACEPEPLGTGGAIKYAAGNTKSTVVVFNGDVLSEIKLGEMIELHKTKKARATIALTPVDNPTAYGLVESDANGNVKRFIEKPDPFDITTNNINAGVYVLEPSTLDRIPDETKYSIERNYFPSLIERNESFLAFIDTGYWLDIGTPAKYLQAHRDILDGRCASSLYEAQETIGPTVLDGAQVHPSAHLEINCYVGHNAIIGRDVYLGEHAVIGHGVTIGPETSIHRSVVWPDSTIGSGVCIDGTIIGHRCQVGDYCQLGPEVVIGDESSISPYTRASDT